MSRINFKKGFTLFELIMVVIIISIVYALMIRKFAFSDSEKKDVLSFNNLPTFMRKTFKNTKDKITLKCLNDCSECNFYSNKEVVGKEYFQMFEKYTKPEVYVLQKEELEKIEFKDHFIDGRNFRVCFEYNLYPNKSTDELVLSYKDRIFLYDNFYEKTKKFKSLSDARDYLASLRDKAKED